MAATRRVAIESRAQGGGQVTQTNEFSRRYGWYALSLLFLVNLLNYFDRNLMSILIEPIRKDLGLSDGQAGLLLGLAFAVVYSLLGVPIARFADTGRRVGVLGVSLAIWSLMTTASGFAGNFVQMFAARLGVGVGEAGGLPSTHALVAEYVPQERRATALSVIAVGGNIGLLMGLLFGGLMNDAFGWRSAFMIAGAPGLLVALVVLTTLREPAISRGRQQTTGPSLREALRTLWGRKAYVYLTTGLGLTTLGAYGQQFWTPTFIIRAFDMSPGETGVFYVVASGPAAILGVLLSGIVADRLSKRDARWPLWIVTFAFALTVPVSMAFYLSPSLTVLSMNPALAMALVIPITMLGVIWTAPCFALIQNLAGARLRATAAAVFMMVTNLVGLSLGPTVTGYLSDLIAPYAGGDGLRYALCIMTGTYLFGIALFLLAARTVAADIALANADE